MGNYQSSKNTRSQSVSPLLPFYAAREKIPGGDMPSVEEIERAAGNAEQVLSATWGRAIVVRVGQHFVVKYGGDVKPIEGQCLLYLERNKEFLPSLQFPRLYAMFQEGGRTFLVMEHLEGQPLGDVEDNKPSVWSSFSMGEKDIIAETLQRGLQELRSLPRPSEAYLYCGIDGNPLPDLFNFSPRRTRLLSGPFSTEDEWMKGLVAIINTPSMTPHKHEFLQRIIRDSLMGYPPVFSHGDLQRKNILVHRRQMGSSSFRVSLVDWEAAGWYPCYWEYFVAIFATHSMKDDFGLYLDTAILEPYRAEWILCHELFERALSPVG